MLEEHIDILEGHVKVLEDGPPKASFASPQKSLHLYRFSNFLPIMAKSKRKCLLSVSPAHHDAQVSSAGSCHANDLHTS